MRENRIQLFAVFVLPLFFAAPSSSADGTGKLETELWQAKIDACAKQGGGRVVVPRGRHVVGQLYLKNGVELHLEDGAVLEGAVGLHNYVLHRLPYSEGDWCAVVMGLNVTNVAITGKGEIFGNGAGFEAVRTRGICWEGFRPRGVFFSESRGIRLEDFKLRDAACWGIVFKCCEDVVARRVAIDSNVNHNNDGFDIEARNVLIEDCDVDASDDAYCVKSNNPDFTVENVVVRNCRVRSHCNGLKIGTATHGTICGVRFEGCRISASRRVYRDRAKMPDDPSAFVDLKGVPKYLCGPGISAICIECVDGGTVEDVTVRDVEVQGFQVPIFVRGGARQKRTCGIPPSNRHVLRDITISNVRGRAESTIASSVSGCPACYPRNVRIEDVDIVCRGAGASSEPVCEPGPEYDDCYPEATMFRELRLPAFGLYVGRAEDVSVENVRFRLRDGDTDGRQPVFVSREKGHAARLSELPAEKPYQFRSDLETVHLADRRDASAVRATNEFAFVRGQSIVAAKDLGEVAERALVDFQDYLRVSMNVDVLTGAAPGERPALSVRRDDSLRAREYAVDVTAEGVDVRAKDGRAAAQALYHLEDLMNLREAPFLTFGKERRRDRFETRMTHSGYGECAFEDAYLSHLAHAGINAIMFFMTGIDTVESLGGYRADNRFDLNAIIRRAKRFGIDTYIYCIFHCFAHPRDPDGKDILDKTFGRILGNYPEAKGCILIGESCEFPSRDPRVQPVSYLNKDPKDPRPAAGWFPCSDRAEWLEAVRGSIHRRAPKMEVVLFTYNWGWAPEADRCKLIDSLPKDISVMSEWEMFQRRLMPNGIESPTADYTIAVPGAGGYFASEAACAHRNGLKLYTMATAGGRTWDFGCAPYIPVPEQWLRRWRGLVDANAKWNLTGIMENHDYGWLPTFLGEIEKETYAEGGLPYDEHVRKIAARDFGAANAGRVVSVWKRWSDEMNSYIPSDVNQYGSFRTGPAYPFVIGKEPVKEGEIPGANPTCCLRLDYLNTGFVFAEKKERVDDEYFRKEIELFEVPLRGYEEGVAAFVDMAGGLSGRKRRNSLRMANLARYLASYYRTAINLKRLAIAHRNGDEAGYLAAARAEYANVKDARDCVSRDSRLGYENNLDYAGGAEQLDWKLRRMERDFGKDNLTKGRKN